MNPRKKFENSATSENFNVILKDFQDDKCKANIIALSKKLQMTSHETIQFDRNIVHKI